MTSQTPQFLKSVKTEPMETSNQSFTYGPPQPPADIKPVLPPGFSLVQAPPPGCIPVQAPPPGCVPVQAPPPGCVPVQMNQLGLPPGQAQALQQVNNLNLFF